MSLYMFVYIYIHIQHEFVSAAAIHIVDIRILTCEVTLTHACMIVDLNMCTYTCMYAYMYVCTYICIYVYIYT